MDQNELPEMPPEGEVESDAPESSDMDGPAAAFEASEHVGDTSNLMPEPAPSDERDVSGDEAPTKEYAEMEPPDDGEGMHAAAQGDLSGGVGEAYVRLDVVVSRGEMSVTNAALVEGPLLVEPDLTGDLVYQAMIGQRQVAAGAMPELGYAIALPPPDDESRGHHFRKLSTFDFSVRIPRGEIALDDLADLHIELFRPTRTTQLSTDLPRALGESFERAASESGVDLPEVVARLDGVSVADMPQEAAEMLRAALR